MMCFRPIEVAPDATAASVTTALVPYTRSGTQSLTTTTSLDQGCCRAHARFKDGMTDVQTKQDRGHGTIEPDVHHWMDHLHSALFHYDSRYWYAINNNLIAQWDHLKVEACRTAANRYYYVECARCKCFIYGQYDKHHKGACSVAKNKLLQWLGTALPDPNENVQLCHVLAKASIVSNFASWCFCEHAMPRSGPNTCRHRRRSATLTLFCPQVGSFHVHCCCIMSSDIGYTAFLCEGPLRQ